MVAHLLVLPLRKLSSTCVTRICKPRVVQSRPETFTIDGISLIPDEKWNLSAAVLRMLDRQLIFEDGNPLGLIKQRIVNFVHKNYHSRGERPLFTVMESLPRVVSVYDNFDSLLVPADHVSRSALDTYYINKDYCLRTHTSAHQHWLTKQGLDNFLVIGDVYRRDTVDRSHYPCFHQIEGVRLFSAAELFNDPLSPDLEPIFEEGSKSAEKQKCHSPHAAKCLVKNLKETLEHICLHVFGNGCDVRWVSAEFPFTHPSFEMEVFYEGKWMEVLGCGVIQQDLLKMAGVVDKVGWAFGLGLERLAMILYGIEDIRLFWSTDSGFLSQFVGKLPSDDFKYLPVSVHPQVLFDLSFWLPEKYSPEEMAAETCELIRSVGGEIIEQVKLLETFEHPKRRRISQTYNLVYRSHERALTKEEVKVVNNEIRSQLVQKYGVSLR